MTRILWNKWPNEDTGSGGDIDEIVVDNPMMVHIEQMNDRCWWIAIYLDTDTYWMGNFVADSRGHMSFTQQEDSHMPWKEDVCHEDS